MFHINQAVQSNSVPSAASLLKHTIHPLIFLEIKLLDKSGLKCMFLMYAPL